MSCKPAWQIQGFCWHERVLSPASDADSRVSRRVLTELTQGAGQGVPLSDVPLLNGESAHSDPQISSAESLGPPQQHTLPRASLFKLFLAMTSAHILASGPVKLRATNLQSSRDRHVHHVVGCSNQQRDSTLRWGRKPATKVQAVSEEVIESLDLPSTYEGNGVSSATAPVTQSTLSVHAGESGGRPKVADSLTTPICCTSTYYFQDTAELIAYQEGRYGSYEYGR